MKRTRPNSRQPWIGICFLSLIIVVGLVGTSFAQQFDAPYYDLQEKNKDKWAAEDEQINAKLAALAKKFGKKPNIIFILADDVGWGEMGWQGGGKHRGTPTPEHLETIQSIAQRGLPYDYYWIEACQ